MYLTLLSKKEELNGPPMGKIIEIFYRRVSQNDGDLLSEYLNRRKNDEKQARQVLAGKYMIVTAAMSLTNQ